MVRGEAVSLVATRSRTWISALLTNARLIEWTIGIAQTLGTTSFVRIAGVLGDTFTDDVLVFGTASGVDSARCRIAGIACWRWWHNI